MHVARRVKGSVLFVISVGAQAADSLPPRSQATMSAARFSDAMPLTDEQMRTRHQIESDPFQAKQFPWQHYFERGNPELARNYSEAIKNAYSPEVNQHNPLMQDWSQTKRLVEENFKNVERHLEDDLATKGLLVNGGIAASEFLLTQGRALVPSVLGSSASDGLSSLAERRMRTNAMKELENEKNKMLREIELLYKEASEEQKREFLEAKKNLDQKIEKVAEAIRVDAEARLQANKIHLAKKTPAASSPTLDQIYEGQGKDARLQFEIARGSIPPDRLLELVESGAIVLPAGVTKEDLDRDAKAYKSSQNYANIQKTVNEMVQVGEGVAQLFANMGMRPASVAAFKKTVSVASNAALLFFPPTPTNIVLRALGILNSLFAKKDDSLQKALEDLQKLQKATFDQVVLIRQEAFQNHAETMSTLQKMFSSMQYDMLHIRSMVGDDIKTKSFAECKLAEDEFLDWQQSIKNSDQIFRPLNYLGPLSLDRLFHCVRSLEHFLAFDVHAYLYAGATAKSTDANVDSRANFALKDFEYAQNSFDTSLKYLDKYTALTKDSLVHFAIPARDYAELVEKLKSEPVASQYKNEFFTKETFRTLVLGDPLQMLVDSSIFMSQFSSNADIENKNQLRIVPDSEVLVKVHSRQEYGYVKRASAILQKTRSIVALSRAQQNIMNGDMLLPTLWENLNAGMFSVYLQRVLDAQRTFSHSSVRYSDTLRVLRENPLMATNTLAWGIWERMRVARRRGEDTAALYQNAYEANSSVLLVAFLNQFTRATNSLQGEERALIEAPALQAKFKIENLPPRMSPWSDSFVKIVCWKEREAMSAAAAISLELTKLNKLDFIYPVVASDDPSRILNRSEYDRRNSLRAQLTTNLAAANSRVTSVGTCEDPQEGGHKWFVQVPYGESYFALPLPSKISSGSLYGGLSLELAYEQSKQIEEEYLDYQWSSNLPTQEAK